MNLPNKLTVLRLVLVPFILVVMLLPFTWYNNILAALIFGAASFTDMLDGKIARKRGLVTDFGKFLDPLADKFMVIAAIFGIVCRYRSGNDLMFWVFMTMLMVTVFRELAVASIRLITAKKAGVVVAADKLGKIKTVVQIVCIELALLEPLLHSLLAHFDPTFFFYGFFALTYLSAILAIVFTIWSGLNYILTYWQYMDPEK